MLYSLYKEKNTSWATIDFVGIDKKELIVPCKMYKKRLPWVFDDKTMEMVLASLFALG